MFFRTNDTSVPETGCGVSWRRTTHDELCFVWGWEGGGHGSMVCWVLSRHRLQWKKKCVLGDLLLPQG